MEENEGQEMSGAETGASAREMGRLAKRAKKLRATRGVAAVFRLIALVVVIVVIIAYVATLKGLYEGIRADQGKYLAEVQEGMAKDVLPKISVDLQERLKDPELRKWASDAIKAKLEQARPEYRQLVQEQAKVLKTYVQENMGERVKQRLSARLTATESKFMKAFPELTEKDAEALVGNLQAMLKGGTDSVLKTRMDRCYEAVDSLAQVVHGFPAPSPVAATDQTSVLKRIIAISFALPSHYSAEELTRITKEFKEIHWPALREQLGQ